MSERFETVEDPVAALAFSARDTKNGYFLAAIGCVDRLNQFDEDLRKERKQNAAMLAELEQVEEDLATWGRGEFEPLCWTRLVKTLLESVRKVIAQAKGES